METFLAILVDQQSIERLGLSLVVSSARPLGFIALFPILALYNLPRGLMMSGVSFGLAVPVMPMIFADAAVFPDLDIIDASLLFAKELVIGALTMLPFALPFWAASVAGAVVEQTSGLGAATEGKEFGGAFSDLFFWILVAILFTAGGFYQLLLEQFYNSYLVWPVFSLAPQATAELWLYLMGMLDTVMMFAWMMALPLLGLFFLIDTVTGLAYRYTPQFNPMMESSGYKVVAITIALIPFCMIFLQSGMQFLVSMKAGLAELQGLVTLERMEVP